MERELEPRRNRMNRRKRFISPCHAVRGKKDERRAAPDFEATTKGVHRGPVRLPCAGDNGRLSPTHGSRTGPKEQHSWGSDDRGKFDRGGTPRHQWSRTPTRLIQGVNLPASVRLVNTNDQGTRPVLAKVGLKESVFWISVGLPSRT